MNAIRMLFLTVAGLLMLGIYLTGFDKAHWFLYVPPAMLAFAALTGICPGLMLWRRLGFRDEAFCESSRAP